MHQYCISASSRIWAAAIWSVLRIVVWYWCEMEKKHLFVCPYSRAQTDVVMTVYNNVVLKYFSTLSYFKEKHYINIYYYYHCEQYATKMLLWFFICSMGFTQNALYILTYYEHDFAFWRPVLYILYFTLNYKWCFKDKFRLFTLHWRKMYAKLLLIPYFFKNNINFNINRNT